MSASPRLPLIGTAAVTALLCAVGAMPSTASSSTASSSTASSSPASLSGSHIPAAAAEPAPGSAISDHPGQTSDGVKGLRVGPPTTSLDARGSFRREISTANDTTFEIAPGVTVREWDQIDGRMPIGQVRMNLVTVDLNAANLSFEYLSPKYVTTRKPVSTLGRWSNALVAVNGDFFDISDTGAPLGVGVDREKRLVTGPRTGWIPENMSLFFDATGPRIGPLSTQWEIRQRPLWELSGVNAAAVPPGGIGLYNYDWGKTSGKSVTGDRKIVREVVIRRQRVISNRFKLSTGRKIRKKDFVLIGVGRAAQQLKTLRKGKRITFKRRIEGGAPQVAITGDRPILIDGVRRVINDRLAHPRTAVGIDVDGRKLYFLVVDGRSATSRGYTMVELANLFTTLGVEHALNLDGGGSSTMWSRLLTGEMGLINEPSDGAERSVPNGLGLVYHGALPPVIPISTPTPTPTPTPTTPTVTPTVSPTPTPTPTETNPQPPVE